MEQPVFYFKIFCTEQSSAILRARTCFTLNPLLVFFHSYRYFFFFFAFQSFSFGFQSFSTMCKCNKRRSGRGPGRNSANRRNARKIRKINEKIEFAGANIVALKAAISSARQEQSRETPDAATEYSMHEESLDVMLKEALQNVKTLQEDIKRLYQK